MAGRALRARPAAGGSAAPRIVDDPEVLRSYLEDAAHFPGGRTPRLALPATEADVAAVLQAPAPVLAIGAQSSLTGGATPFGETLLSTTRLNRIERIARDRVRAGAGVTLAALDEFLAGAGACYPPTPTFLGATVGGIIATNAAGAATFKYGTTRDWVEAITVVLPGGEVLDIERGATRAEAGGRFELQLRAMTARVPVPRYRMPRVAKLSAGYFAAPQTDLIDLFIGSEGTLGIVTAATLRVVPVRPAIGLALVPFDDRAAALALARRLRDASRATWRDCSSRGIDAIAIELMDARSLTLLREDGADRLNGVVIPQSARAALLVSLEFAPAMDSATAFEEIGRALDADAPDSPLVRFCRLLDSAGTLERVQMAVPGDRTRAARLTSLREAVPAGVNQRIGRARQRDARIEKIAADVIVPFDRVAELLDICDAAFRRHGLDAAVWGHLSDGNLHPNVIPRSADDVDAGKTVILEVGREAMRLGGAPLAEHGVGRNRVKQQLLRDLYGEEGIDEMRRVKRAIDPDWKLAPGVLFPRARG